MIAPSLLEGSSRPALESMAFGTPVIALLSGQFLNWWTKKQACWSLQETRTRSLRNDRFAARDDAIDSLGLAERKRAVARFDWDSIARRVLGVCKQVAST